MSTTPNRPAALDACFREAVSAIDAGNIDALERLVTATPALVRERLASPGAWLRDKVDGALDGFFERPYLLWFVADPVRNGTLPGADLNAKDAAWGATPLGWAQHYLRGRPSDSPDKQYADIAAYLQRELRRLHR
jgi:hypothetical protein